MREDMRCDMTNLEVICFVLGWQGGTLEQVAKALNVHTDIVLNADNSKMLELCRKAQLILRCSIYERASCIMKESLDKLTRPE